MCDAKTLLSQFGPLTVYRCLLVHCYTLVESNSCSLYSQSLTRQWFCIFGICRLQGKGSLKSKLTILPDRHKIVQKNEQKSTYDTLRAASVPRGILVKGSLRSPLMFIPASIPVTVEKNKPNMEKKLSPGRNEGPELFRKLRSL